MDTEFISLRSLLVTAFLSLFFVAFSYLIFSSTDPSKIVFCDVGQGDAAYIRTLEGTDLLVDSGPSQGVLQCLGEHMPFWDRKIEAVFLTHPQKDHFGGLSEVVSRYQVEHVFTVPVGNQEAASFLGLLKNLREHQTDVQFLYAGDTLKIDDKSKVVFLWPTRSYTEKATTVVALDPHSNDALSVLGLATSISDLNNFSQIFLFSQGNLEVLFTGDASPMVLAGLAGSVAEFLTTLADHQIEILKVPHHGSKNGLTQGFLHAVSPQVAVISAGKKNPFGHPSSVILNLLQQAQVKTLTTARYGSIVFETDAEAWKLLTPSPAAL